MLGPKTTYGLILFSVGNPTVTVTRPRSPRGLYLLEILYWTPTLIRSWHLGSFLRLHITTSLSAKKRFRMLEMQSFVRLVVAPSSRDDGAHSPSSCGHAPPPPHRYHTPPSRACIRLRADCTSLDTHPHASRNALRQWNMQSICTQFRGRLRALSLDAFQAACQCQQEAFALLQAQATSP